MSGYCQADQKVLSRFLSSVHNNYIYRKKHHIRCFFLNWSCIQTNAFETGMLLSLLVAMTTDVLPGDKPIVQ